MSFVEENRIRLHRILVERFDEGELRTLCFGLGVDYDGLPGAGKADKARELIAYLERRHDISQLVKVGKTMRPDISWEAVSGVSKESEATPSTQSLNTLRGCLVSFGNLRIALLLVVPTLLFFVLLTASTILSPYLLSTRPSPTQMPTVTVQSDNPEKQEQQTIEIDNCGGRSDAIRTEQRSQTIDVTISTELAAKLGLSSAVISTEVQDIVSEAMGKHSERSTSIQLTAPPRTRMLFSLVWSGEEQTGVVQNLGAPNVPIVFRVFTPTDVRVKSQFDIGCSE